MKNLSIGMTVVRTKGGLSVGSLGIIEKIDNEYAYLKIISGLGNNKIKISDLADANIPYKIEPGYAKKTPNKTIMVMPKYVTI